MLGKNYRFKLYNGTHVSIGSGDASVKARRWRFAGDGSLEYEGSEGTVLNLGTSLNHDAYISGTSQDNSTDQWCGGDFVFTFDIGSGTPSGEAIVYFERSTDGGSVFDDDGLGHPVCSIYFGSSGTKTASFSL